jgi:hypothetical protein
VEAEAEEDEEMATETVETETGKVEPRPQVLKEIPAME